jgi:hypothetical protein
MKIILRTYVCRTGMKEGRMRMYRGMGRRDGMEGWDRDRGIEGWRDV